MSDQHSDSGRATGLGLTPLHSGEGRTATTSLHWHFVSAGVIAMVATAFLAVLDAGHDDADVSRSAMRPAAAGAAAAVARPADRLRMANAGESSVAPAVSNLAPLPAWAPSLRPVLPAESPVPSQALVIAPPAVEQPAVAEVAPTPPPAPPAPPASRPPTELTLSPPPAGAPARTAAAPPARSDPAETASIERGAASPQAPAKAERSGLAAGVIASAQTPAQCLPQELRAVLADVAARFGAVTLVSTTHLHTDNHSPGSARAKMHANCKAVDFKTSGGVKEVMAYLRTRKEVGGINTYRNGVIHIDANAGYQVAAEPPRATPPPRPKTAANPSLRKKRR